MLQRLMIACAIYGAVPDSGRRADHRPRRDRAKGDYAEFRAINHELGITILVVTHDFGVVAELADQVVVLRQGAVIESGDVFRIFDHPGRHIQKPSWRPA